MALNLSSYVTLLSDVKKQCHQNWVSGQTCPLSKCRLVVVEEAAQVLEGHVIAALPPSTQHLIMIGELTFKGVFSRSFLGHRSLITLCSWIRRQIQKTLEFRPKFLFLQPGLWVKVPNDLTISTWTTIYCKYLDVFEFQPGLWGKW